MTSTQTTSAEPARKAWVEQLMGMPISIHLRGELGGADTAVAAAYDSLREVDGMFSTYRADSPVSAIRRGELTIEEAPQSVRGVAALCEQARSLTEGWFDAYLPDPQDPHGPRLFDPTGLVKGWAVQRVCVDLAEALPEADVLVNAGGDIAVHCPDPHGPGWHLGVESPLKRGSVIGEVTLHRGGLATSGTAVRGQHILSPFEGRSVADWASISVAGPSLMWADVLATAAFAMGPDATTWLPRQHIYTWMSVAPDGTSTAGAGRAAS